jgi:3-phosphoshikimate 1-carboxyvinyltransferase
MIEIKIEKIKNSEVVVPGSKSYTHRILIASALSDGICHIHNSLKSEDTLLTLAALRNLGIKIEIDGDKVVVHGQKGEFKACDNPIDLGNSGTSMRFLTAVAALGQGVYTLTGSKRMQERPLQDLISGLNQIGVAAHAVNANGCPPVQIDGGKVEGGNVELSCSISSQFLSALLFIAPYTQEGIDVAVIEGPVSRPYVDMTVAIMEKFGIRVNREGYKRFKVRGGQIYSSGTYVVEPDCSQAGYFWAAAAITGAAVKVRGVRKDSFQGDVRFTELLAAMGCKVLETKDGIEVVGGSLTAIEADMGDMPDLVPTLAVVAAFARGTTIIKNVAHLKAKESDRLASVLNELTRMGIDATYQENGLAIRGGIPCGAEIETYGDHRIAMSFAVAGLKVPGICIKDERCVEKSFPNFWEVFEGLYQK